MEHKHSFVQLAISLALIILILGRQGIAAETTQAINGTVNKRTQSQMIPDLKAVLAKELAQNRLTSPSNLAAVHAMNPLWATDAERNSGEKNTAEETKPVEKKGWWGRNWPWVVLPALGVAAGFGGAAAAGAFSGDHGDQERMMGSRPNR